MAATTTKVKRLILDAGPLLSLTPLRGLAERYLTVPQVLDELKDKRAREHFERLALTAGVQIETRSPDAVSLMKVTEFAKKTGDYAVLSHADLCVLALTYAVDKEAKSEEQRQTESSMCSSQPVQANTSDVSSGDNFPDALQDLVVSLASTHVDGTKELTSSSRTGLEVEVTSAENSFPDSAIETNPLFEDPSSGDDDDGGEWITPTNVELHKSRALELLPAEEVPNRTRHSRGGLSRSAEPNTLAVGCMTADFAMQNVLLQMGLDLIGVEGKRINRIKTWVLRCHACFKICKDPSKKFCPSCGNPTLLRTSVSVCSPFASATGEAMLQVHLKKNFQWRTRGTKYSIPTPKPGSSKTGGGEGLILREDQTDWLRAEKRVEGRKLKEEKRMINAISTNSGSGVKLDWMDPDWLPEMLVVGAGGKGRSDGKSDMPPIGYGRQNPNERKRRKR